MLSLLNAKMSGDSTAMYYSAAYLAPTTKDAEADFVNMLPVDNTSPNVKIRGNILQPTRPLSKKQIVRALQITSLTNDGQSGDDARKSDQTSSNIYVLPEEMGMPNSIESPTTGSISEVEYCRPSGSASGGSGGLLPLCSMCAMTTKLPTNYFPRFINEIHCNGTVPSIGDGCLHINGMSMFLCFFF